VVREPPILFVGLGASKSRAPFATFAREIVHGGTFMATKKKAKKKKKH
jgi:hypothetical protein